MNRRVCLAAALIAGVVMSGCALPLPDPGHSVYVRHGVDDKVVIHGGAASVQSQAAPAALPAAPVTGWVRIPDGTLVERASCVVGSRKWLRDPQWPGWAVHVECRAIAAPAASQAPATYPTPAATPATTTATGTSRTTVKRLPDGTVETYTLAAAQPRGAPSDPCKDASKKWVLVSDSVDPATLWRKWSYACR